MNAPQKGVLLTGGAMLVFAVLVAEGMDWNGLGMIAGGVVLAIAGIMYVLRGAEGASDSDAPDREAQ
ncbi:MAG: hypothetical protein ACXW2L_18815 [Burkholderiales bacterium]